MSHNSSNSKTYCCDRTISQFGAMVASLSVWRMSAFAIDTTEIRYRGMHLHATISTSALNRLSEYRAVSVYRTQSPPSPRTLGARAPRVGRPGFPFVGRKIDKRVTLGWGTTERREMPRGASKRPLKLHRLPRYLPRSHQGSLTPTIASHFRAAFVPRYYYECPMIWTSEIILF